MSDIDRRFDCVIFDMDGTLTEPHLDFAAIRAELGIPADEGILEGLAVMTPARAAAAHRTLHDYEMDAAANAQVAKGAVEVLTGVRTAGMAVALLTRNSRPAMRTFLMRLDFDFDLMLSREDGPIKPDPSSIQATCRQLGATPIRTACVGDWGFDVEAANAAGCTSILLARGRQLDFADQADHVIETLAELHAILGL